MPPNPPRVIRTVRLSRRWSLELLWRLAVHRVNLRYKETLFGFGWIFLQPVALTIIFTYIFHRFARIPSEVPYPLFSATGLVAWSLTALVVGQAAISLTGNATLLRRVALPRILLPVSAVVSALIDLGVMGLLLIGLFAYYRVPLPWTAVWMPALLLLHVVLLVGLSCLISLFTVLLRDVAQAIPSLLQLWFFASPVFYPFSLVPDEFKILARWNPMTGLIEGYRATLLLGQPPPMELLGPTMLVIAGIVVLGVVCFRRLEETVVDLL